MTTEQNTRGWKYYDAETKACTKQDFETTIRRGRLLIEAKAELEKDAFEALAKRHYSMSTAKKLMLIADHPIVGNPRSSRANSSDLPHSWDTLYQMTRLDNDVLTAALKDGTINSKTERKDVAAMRKDSKPKTKTFTGPKADIIEAVKSAGNKGRTSDELQAMLTQHNGQTVNSAVNWLHKTADVLRLSGEKRKTRAKGGRPAVAYIYNPDPQPKPKADKKKSASVVDFSAHRIAAMVEDDSIIPGLKQWAKGKTEQERIVKSYKILVPLIGTSRGGILKLGDLVKLDDEHLRVALKEGRAFTMKL